MSDDVSRGVPEVRGSKSSNRPVVHRWATHLDLTTITRSGKVTLVIIGSFLVVYSGLKASFCGILDVQRS